MNKRFFFEDESTLDIVISAPDEGQMATLAYYDLLNLIDAEILDNPHRAPEAVEDFSHFKHNHLGPARSNGHKIEDEDEHDCEEPRIDDPRLDEEDWYNVDWDNNGFDPSRYSIFGSV